MAIENIGISAQRHPALDGLAALAWNKPKETETLFTSIANSGLITPEEVIFSRMPTVVQAKLLYKLIEENLGILAVGISGIRSNETQVRGAPIMFLVEKGMPKAFKEILERTAPGVEIFVQEAFDNDPLTTGKR